MAPFLPILALTRSQSVRIGNAQNGTTGNKVPQELGVDVRADQTTSTPFYVDLGDGTARRDLQRHGAIGAYVVVGPITNSNVNPVVNSGGAATLSDSALTATTTAGELYNRLTGTYEPFSAGNQTFTLTTAAGQSQVFLVSVNNTTGALTTTAGTPATTGSEVTPPTPATDTPLYSVDLANGAANAAAGTFVDLRPRP